MSAQSHRGSQINKSQEREKNIRRDFSRQMYRRIQGDLGSMDPAGRKGQEYETIREVSNTLGDIDQVYMNVDRTNEAILDIETLQAASKITAETTRNMELGSAVAFKVHDYITAIKAYMGAASTETTQRNLSAQSEDIEDPSVAGLLKLGAAAASWCARPSTTDFMIGPMDVEYTKPKPRQITKRERATGPASKVGTIEMNDVKQDGNKMTHIIKDIYEILVKNEATDTTPVGLIDFTFNPQSYSQTIENLFYLSFLVRDGKVGVVLDEDEIPSIYYVPLPQDAEQRQKMLSEVKTLATNQMIFDLDMETYYSLMDAFDLVGREPLIPHRVPVAAAAPTSGQWYG